MQYVVQLTAYELGIVKNCLRERRITIEDFRRNLKMDYDDEVAINQRIDGFIIELTQIQEKIDIVLNDTKL